MYTHINDRSNLDGVVARRISGPITRREDLAESHGHRTDVVLINGTRSGSEYSLSVGWQGFKGDLWILDILTHEQYEQVQAIAKQMRLNAAHYPPAWKLLL